MSLRRGDIVLVPFPFTDLSSKKVRPAVILSPDPQQEDVIVAFISSVIPLSLSRSEYLLSQDDADFKASGLKVSSVFKTHKVMTLSRSRILRHLGRLAPPVQSEIDEKIAIALGLKA